MSTLLIALLGDAPAGAPRPGPDRGPFRLPGGERLTHTPNLGLELARALQAQSIVFAGSSTAYFEHLLDELPESARIAPIAQPEPQAADESQPEAHAEAAVAAPSETATEGAAAPEEGAPASDQATSSAKTEDEAPAAELRVPAEVVTSEDPQSAEGAAAAAPEGHSEADSDGEREGDTAAEDAESQDSAESHEGEEARSEGRSGRRRRDRRPRSSTPDLRPLADRIRAMVETGRPDRDALDALAERLREHLGAVPGSRVQKVRCLILGDGMDRRSVFASVQSLANLADSGQRVVLDATHARGSHLVLALLANQFFRWLRPDLPATGVVQGDLNHRDSSGAVSLHELEAVHEFVHWLDLFKDIKEGHAPAAFHEICHQDQRLRSLASPYVRYQRGLRFGALGEVVSGAEGLEEARRSTRDLPYGHPYKLFARVLNESIRPVLSERRASLRQLQLARQSHRVGQLPYAALHLREAMLSAVLEAYGRDATTAWMAVPDSGGAQEVRPREIAGYILGLPEAATLAPDLNTAWPLLATSRNRYVNTTAIPVPASQLKDEDHEIKSLMDMCSRILEGDLLAGLPEAIGFVEAAKTAIDVRAVRAVEPRRDGPGGRRARPGRGLRGDRRPPREGEAEGGERGPRPERPPRGDRHPRGDRPPREDRAPRGDRPPREDRPRGDRPPREGGPRRPGRDRDDRRPEGGEDRGESAPRVQRVGGGLGNLGFALAEAGLVARPPKEPKRDAPKHDGQPNRNLKPGDVPISGMEGASEAPPAVKAPAAPTPETAPKFDVAGPGEPPTE